ncbi:TM2 domain-containing protein [Cellulomonas sp.]|uniref:TM2 domain-containing protein n=1 Tax=Cellulomonas sp. TaxID=40001 RepID=UPI001B060532|nr:TM2 domain-containing protein [Cellulomonas sp.]MBO9555885.1 TM2 domain-containing protein [Cellulomonas sp.]
MTDTIDRPSVLDLDLDDAFERPVVTRKPPRPPAPPGPPISATFRYPPGPVPDLQDAPRDSEPPADPWSWPWQAWLVRGAWGLCGSRAQWGRWGGRAWSGSGGAWSQPSPARTTTSTVRREGATVGSAWPWTWQRSRVAAGLLGVFLGAFGLHRMYLGYWKRGLTMLAITVVGGFFTLGLAALVMVVWGFFEGLLYLSVRRGRFARDARGRPLRG